jgi:DMSO/TMAO reductase YedYZ heme-binding membrane subunit
VSRWRAAVLFDLAVAALIAVYIAAFLWAGAPASDLITPDILRIRAFGTAALILWTAWLAAAPLARLEPRLAVLGVHAGHLAVATLAAGAAHAWLVLNWYHDIGALNPLVALLADNPRFRSLTGFPYELLGVAALLLTLAVAAASHPFWRTRFGAGLAALSSTGYGLAVLHIAFGALQSERDAVYAAALVAAFAGVIALHLAAGAREGAADRWRTPLRLTRWFGVAVAAGLCVSTGTALVLAHAQRNPGPGGWGGGEVSVSGILDPLPYPVIHAGLRSDGRPASAVILVAEGKFGAPEEFRSFAGKPVEDAALRSTGAA